MSGYQGFIIRENGNIVKVEEDKKRHHLKKKDIMIVVFQIRYNFICDFGIISKRYPFRNIYIPEEDEEKWNYSVPTVKQWESILKLYAKFNKKEGR